MPFNRRWTLYNLFCLHKSSDFIVNLDFKRIYKIKKLIFLQVISLASAIGLMILITFRLNQS